MEGYMTVNNVMVFDLIEEINDYVSFKEISIGKWNTTLRFVVEKKLKKVAKICKEFKEIEEEVLKACA